MKKLKGKQIGEKKEHIKPIVGCVLNVCENHLE